ncbi:MAG: SGNH/GDSL hydrolase family protein [Microcoleaceae cyanobacterium]
MKLIWIVPLALAGLAIALEVGLRLIFGFGKPLVYIADPEIGYLLAPSQTTRRFGNRIQINEYSMRSNSPIQPLPDDVFRVLLLGDSIVNGAWWTDQSETLSALIEQQLTAANSDAADPQSTSQISNPLQRMEVLNASANSWGPPNQIAYLRKFGVFQAQVIVLVINTDDLFAGIPNPEMVGQDPNYPNHKPALAILEVANRYRSRQQSARFPVPTPPKDIVGFNLEAIQAIHSTATQQGIEFLLAHTPLLREVGQPGPRDYELKARQRLQDLAQGHNIDYIDFLPQFNQAEQPQMLYRDHIHLSSEGNQQVSQAIRQKVQPFTHLQSKPG